MLEKVLKAHGTIFRLSVKSGITLLCIFLAVALPQAAHVYGGASAGTRFLPMYAPALLAGCLLGRNWGLAVGALSPLASFAFTSLALGSAMPIAEKLPAMVAEIGVFGFVSGMFAGKISDNAIFAFPAVLTAQLIGRTVFVSANLISGAELNVITTALQSGIIGICIQAVTIPIAVALLSALLKGKENE